MNNRIQSMSKMKLATIVAVAGLAMTSCVLSEPLNYGEPCEGVTSVISPAKGEVICTLDEANPEGKCGEYQKIMADGFCPHDFKCQIPSLEDGEVFCHDGCKENEIVCDGKCVKSSDREYCGARGTCDSKDEDSKDYRGKKCNEGQSCKADGDDNYKCSNDLDCGIGTHINPDTSKCEIDTNENCGEMGNACVGDEICSGGVCAESCNTGEDGSVKEIACVREGEKKAVCIDPMTDPDFCGADDNCEHASVCKGDKPICHEGVCMDECEIEAKTSCKSSEGNIQCFDLNTDINHCGDCNHACDLTVSENVQVTCELGQCKYECKDDYTDCQTDGSGIPVCYNLKEDIDHCGTCDNVCSEPLICTNGSCVPKTCESDTVCQANGCTNSNTQCGKDCHDCTSEGDAADGICNESGACVITKCKNGYALSAGKCIQIGQTFCTKADGSSSEHKDCTTMEGVLNPGCDQSSGTCVVEACKEGYHLYNKTCEKNDNNHCGKHDQKCPGSSTVENASTYTCTLDGKCNVSACKDGFRLSGNKCEKCDVKLKMFVARETQLLDGSVTLPGGSTITVHYKKKNSGKDPYGKQKYKINISYANGDGPNNNLNSFNNAWINADYVNYLTKVKSNVTVAPNVTLNKGCADSDGYARIYNTMNCSGDTLDYCDYNVECEGNFYGWVKSSNRNSLDAFIQNLDVIPEC